MFFTLRPIHLAFTWQYHKMAKIWGVLGGGDEVTLGCHLGKTQLSTGEGGLVKITQVVRWKVPRQVVHLKNMWWSPPIMDELASKLIIGIILEYILLGVCTSIISPGSAWFLRPEPQNWALHLCWFPLTIHAETLSHKLVIFCALVKTNTSPTSCLWDWWFLKWLIHSQGSGVKFTQKTLYSYVHKFKLGIQGFRSDQRVL